MARGFRRQPIGWQGESYRHYLAAKGVKTRSKAAPSMRERVVGGRADFCSDAVFDKRQLQKGVRHEMEHTREKAIAKEIAKDHLVEDPKYYDHLNEMERRLKKQKSYMAEKGDAAEKTAKFLKWFADDGRAKVDDLVVARRNAEQQQVFQEVLRKLDETVNNGDITYNASNDFIRQGGPFEDETKDFLDGKVDLPTYRANVAKRLSVHVDQNRRTLQVTPSNEGKSLKVFEW